jgi:hypothetical protein
MNTLRNWWPWAIVAGLTGMLLLGRAPASAEGTHAAPRVKWEYLVERPGGDPPTMYADINKRGEEGWEYAGTAVLSHVDSRQYIIYKRHK